MPSCHWVSPRRRYPIPWPHTLPKTATTPSSRCCSVSRQRHYCGAGSGQCWPGSCNRWLPVTKASTKCTSTMLCGSYKETLRPAEYAADNHSSVGLQGVDKEGGEVFTTHVGRSAADAHGRSPHDGAAGSLLHHGTGHTPEELGRDEAWHRYGSFIKQPARHRGCQENCQGHDGW